MVPYDLDDIRSRAAALKLHLSELLRAREEALLNFSRQKRLGELSAQEAGAKEKQEREAGLHRIRTRLVVEQDRAGARHARSVPRIERGFSNACTRIREKLRLSVDRIAEEERRTRDDALNILHEKHRVLEDRLSGHRSDVEALLAESGEIERAIARLYSHVGSAPEGNPAARPAELPVPEEVAPRVRETLRALRKNLGERWRDARLQLLRFTPITGVAIVLLMACAAAAFAVHSKWQTPPPTLAAAAGLAWIGTLMICVLIR